MKSAALAAMTRHISGGHINRHGVSAMSHMEHGIGHFFRSVENHGTNLAMSYVNGRFGDKGEFLIPGTQAPADLTGGIVLHGLQMLLSLSGRGHRFADHTHAMADGLIAPFVTRFGTNLGLAHKGTAPKVAGVHGRRYRHDGTPVDADAIGNAA